MAKRNPVGKPLGDGKSGLRVVIVRGDQIEHRFYDFGELPDRIELAAKLTVESN